MNVRTVVADGDRSFGLHREAALLTMACAIVLKRDCDAHRREGRPVTTEHAATGAHAEQRSQTHNPEDLPPIHKRHWFTLPPEVVQSIPRWGNVMQ